MATTNRERVGLALDLLKERSGTPFIAREFINHVTRGAPRQNRNWIFDRLHDQRRIFSQGEPKQGIP